MKSMTLLLAAVMSFNGSFAFAASVDTPLIQLKADLSTLELERDDLKADINESALRIQALEDIASDDLAATYREHKSVILMGVGVAGTGVAKFFSVAPDEEVFLKGGKANLLQKTLPYPSFIVGVSALVALMLTDSDQEDKFHNMKAQYKGMSDERQLAEYTRTLDEGTALQSKLAALEQKISLLNYLISKKD